MPLDRSLLGLMLCTLGTATATTKFTPLVGQIDDDTLPYTRDAPLAQQVAESLASSLDHLGTEYIDSYVLHEQMASADDMLEVWRTMEAAYDTGTVHLIGVANIDAQRLTWLLERCRIKPAFVQNRCRGRDGWDAPVRAVCDTNGIMYQGFWLITGNRELLKHPDVAAAAEWHQRAPGQLVMRFYVQDGMIALTGSTKMDQVRLMCLCFASLICSRQE
jgi:diketogulonate reductase-like aldo/keto reductase